MTRPAPALALLLALASTACTANLRDAPVTLDAPVVEALSWIRHLTPGAEAHCRTQQGQPRICRAYTGSWGEHYVVHRHPINLELLAIWELREWAGGVRAVLVWERPEKEDPREARDGMVL